MKYIKEFRIFESISSEIEDEIYKLCEYSLASIGDNGFDYVVGDDYIVVSLEDENGDLGQIEFDYNDIKEDFIIFLEHLNDKVDITNIQASGKNISYDDIINDKVEIGDTYIIMIHIETKKA